MQHQSIDIRTFSSPQEIQGAVPNFIENNPISKTNYKRLIGDYNFGEEVHCCFAKDNGNLCGEPHKRGWVAELQDGSATIIGNKCAQDKFGADSRLIADRSRYINEKRRLDRLAAVQSHLTAKPQRLAQLQQLRGTLENLESRILAFSNQFGPSILRRLQDMVRTRRSDVVITAVKYREEVDGDGRTKRERSVFAQKLGALAGLDLTSRSSYLQIYYAIDDVVAAYRSAEELAHATNLKRMSKEIDALASRLNAHDRIIKEGSRLIELERLFFNNNFLLLCFLESDKTERFKAAKIAMHRAGVAGGKDDAKAWIAEQEKAIRRQLGVDAIEIR